jgi:hypothetical protein
MTARSNGDASEPRCDSCGDTYPGDISQAMVRGWGHWAGQDHGGSARTHTICRKCRTVGHMRPLRPGKDFEDEPMF